MSVRPVRFANEPKLVISGVFEMSKLVTAVQPLNAVGSIVDNLEQPERSISVNLLQLLKQTLPILVREVKPLRLIFVIAVPVKMFSSLSLPKATREPAHESNPVRVSKALQP